MRKYAYILAAQFAAAFTATGASADIIVNDVPTGIYNQGGESIFGPTAIVNGKPVGFEADAFGLFVPGANYQLTELDLGTTWVSGTNQFKVELIDGIEVGPVLAQWTISNLPSLFTATNIFQDITGISGIELLAGQHYTIEILPSASDSFGVFNNAQFDAFPASFRVFGTPVGVTSSAPEPATFALLGSVLLGGSFWARRRRSRGQGKESTRVYERRHAGLAAPR